MVSSSLRRIVCVWAALGLSLGCGASTTPEEAKADDVGSLSRRSAAPMQVIAPVADTAQWRVVSFNINFGVGHEPINIATVAELDADLVLLQETTDASEEAFREALGDRYPHILFRQCCNAGGLGVLSKHPIREQEYMEPTVGWFPAWRLVVDGPLGPVQVLNVHLRPPMSDGGSWVAGFWSTRSVRRDEMEDLWEHMDPELPTIVAGDFNENAKGKAVELLAQEGLVSALPQLHPRATTWRWPTKVGEIHGMLDHVMYSDRLRLQNARVVKEGNSDHFPVVVVLGSGE